MLSLIGPGRPERANVYIDGKPICECRVNTRFPHCFENDWFYEAHGAINRVLEDWTGITPSHATISISTSTCIGTCIGTGTGTGARTHCRERFVNRRRHARDAHFARRRGKTRFRRRARRMPAPRRARTSRRRRRARAALPRRPCRQSPDRSSRRAAAHPVGDGPPADLGREIEERVISLIVYRESRINAADRRSYVADHICRAHGGHICGSYM